MLRNRQGDVAVSVGIRVRPGPKGMPSWTTKRAAEVSAWRIEQKLGVGGAWDHEKFRALIRSRVKQRLSVCDARPAIASAMTSSTGMSINGATAPGVRGPGVPDGQTSVLGLAGDNATTASASTSGAAAEPIASAVPREAR